MNNCTNTGDQSAPRAIKDVKVGDIILNKEGYEAEVFEVLTNSFLKSMWHDFGKAATWYKFTEAEAYGWKIKGSEEGGWNKEENLRIIIKDNGTAEAVTWEHHYYSGGESPTPTLTTEGVHFDREQTKAVNALVETSVKQAEENIFHKIKQMGDNQMLQSNAMILGELLTSLQDTNPK